MILDRCTHEAFACIRTVVLLLVATVAASAPCGFAAETLREERASRFDEAVPLLLKRYGVPGASITYVEDRKIVYNRAFGFTNTILRTRVGENTRFQVGSVGKPVAAYVTLKLVREGLLQLDRPVDEYLPRRWASPRRWAREITLRQLLSHTSGLSNSLLPVDRTVHFEPGKRFEYSGVGYTYLTKIVEIATGLPFDEVAKVYLFESLGMSATSFNMPFMMAGAYPHVALRTLLLCCLGPVLVVSLVLWGAGLIVGKLTRCRYSGLNSLAIASYVAGSVVVAVLSLLLSAKLMLLILATSAVFAAVVGGMWLIGRRLIIAVPLTLGFFVVASIFLPVRVPFDMVPQGANAAFSLISTGKDLGLFAAHLLSSGKGPDDVQGLLDEQVRIDDHQGWTLGFGIERVTGRQVYWHSGINPGTRSLMVIDPKRGKAIIVLTNGDNGFPLARDVAELALGVRARWDVR